MIQKRLFIKTCFQIGQTRCYHCYYYCYYCCYDDAMSDYRCIDDNLYCDALMVYYTRGYLSWLACFRGIFYYGYAFHKAWHESWVIRVEYIQQAKMMFFNWCCLFHSFNYLHLHVDHLVHNLMTFEQHSLQKNRSITFPSQKG